MRFILVTSAAALFAAPAMAQDAPPPPADTGTVSSMGAGGFNGFYVGAAGGYDVQGNDVGSSVLFDRNLDGRFGDSVLTGTGANAFNPGFCNGRATAATLGPRGCRNDRDGWAYYGRVGIDTQRAGIVVGVVGEFGKTEINDQVTGFSSTPANYVLYRSINWEAGIRARAGYTPNDTTLFYGTFGPGYARIDRDFTSSQSTNQFQQRGRRNQFGVQGGGGIEQRIGSNFSIGLEYMYHQYRDDDFRVRAVSGSGAVTPFTNPNNGGTSQGTDFRRSDTQFRWHSMRATVGFRF